MERDDVIADAVSRAPSKCQKLLRRAFDGDSSPRQAIKAKCLDCTCWNRAEIAACPVYRCPLWAYRPFQAGDAEEAADS